MPSIEIPSYNLLQRFFRLLESENANLVPGCRWLLLGPKPAGIILPKNDEPALDDLVALLRLLRDQAFDLQKLGKTLIRHSEHEEDALVELCVDQLLEHSDWEHPTQMLERPRPDFGKLFAACQARLESTPERQRAEVAAMTAKVERAVRIEESARERRERMRRGRRRKPRS